MHCTESGLDTELCFIGKEILNNAAHILTLLFNHLVRVSSTAAAAGLDNPVYSTREASSGKETLL